MNNLRTQKNKTRGNGEGTLYFHKTKNKWIGQFYINGNRKTITQHKNESITNFKKRFNKILNEINQGIYLDKSNETVISIAKQYIEAKHDEGITEDRTYRRDLETLKQIEKNCSNFCNIPIQNVTIKQINDSKKNIRKYANSVISKIWKLLDKSFEIACSPSRRILLYNLMKDETLKKPFSDKKTNKVKALSNEEFEKLNNILDNEERYHKYRNIIKMQSISGMRIGEVLARTFNDYNENTHQFNIHNTLTQDENYNIVIGKHTKTYNKNTQIDEGQRFLPLKYNLFNEIIDIIKEQHNSNLKNINNFIFWDYQKNDFITPSQVNSWLKRLNNKYHITEDSLTTHRLRHTALTRWSEKNIALGVIQYLAGHINGSKTTANVYIDITLDFVGNELEKAR